MKSYTALDKYEDQLMDRNQLDDNDRWEFRNKKSKGQYNDWYSADAYSAGANNNNYSSPNNGEWVYDNKVQYSVADDTLRRRPPEKDEWEYFDSVEGMWHSFLWDVETGIKIVEQGYVWHIPGHPDHSTYSNPPTLRRKQKPLQAEETIVKTDTDTGIASENDDNNQWEYTPLVGPFANIDWFSTRDMGEVSRDGVWHSLDGTRTYSVADGTLRRRPPEKDKWEVRYNSGNWDRVIWPDAVIATRDGYEYAPGISWSTTTSPPTLRRCKAEESELNTKESGQGSLPVIDKEPGDKDAQVEDVSAKVETQCQIHWNTPRRAEFSKLQDLVHDHNWSLAALKENIERIDAKTGAPAVTPEVIGDAVNALPSWAESDESRRLLLYQTTDACELKSGAVVWDKLTGAGPFVVFAPSKSRPGFLALTRGLVKESTNTMCENKIDNDWVWLPSSLLTDKDPNPQPEDNSSIGTIVSGFLFLAALWTLIVAYIASHPGLL